MIYSPIVPEHCDKLVSQIDIMPTVLGLLILITKANFGQDVLQVSYKPELLFQPIKI
jgi:phosphoglycerol transferase MdoB-like AlkP superfamily enzyme